MAARVGDPTELAILIAAAERGIHREEIEASNRRVAEFPFDSVLKRMSIERADGRMRSPMFGARLRSSRSLVLSIAGLTSQDAEAVRGADLSMRTCYRGTPMLFARS